MDLRTMLKRSSACGVAMVSPLLLTAQTSSAGMSAAQPANLAAVSSVVECSTLAATDLSEAVGAPAHVVSAVVVNDGKVAPYCKAMVDVETDVHFEVHLPVAGWTQRFLLGTRCESNGSEQVACMPDEAKGHFVQAFTNGVMNHRFHEDAYATDYALRIEFAYRGVHLLTVATKALAAKFYGQGPRYSYFAGCSAHGREALMEAQRFPEDYNGIIAGAAPSGFTVQNTFYYGWNILKNTGADGKPILSAEKLGILHQAVLAQCDAADGLKDGLVSDPFSCHPDLGAVACKAGEDPSTCLSPEQVQVAQELYRGAHDAAGERLVPAGELPGSELLFPGWGGGGKDEQGTLKTIKYMVSEPNPPESFALADLKFDRATFDATTKLHSLFDATDPNLNAFAKQGHKLILWHGLADPTVSPMFAVDYYTAMEKQMSERTVEGFSRLYLAPGVGHCTGGEGPAIVDLLTPLMAWVERGAAPGAVLSSYPQPAPGSVAAGTPLSSAPAAGVAPAAATHATRPVYPYPFIAKYVGTGDVHDANNFVQGPARPATAQERSWMGAESFYKPGYERWCSATGGAMACKDSQ